jgi:hypothetical protein
MAKEKFELDDKRETISMFKDKIDMAKITGEEWVETSKEIIDYFNPRGLGGNDYFIYQGVRVCEPGKREGVEKREAEDLQDAVFGKIGIIEGRTA